MDHTTKGAIMESVGKAEGFTSGAAFSTGDIPRLPRTWSQGSGILCPHEVEVAGETVACGSPLTRQIGSGQDVDDRPLRRMLCETCGYEFVAITVGIEGIPWSEVAVTDEERDDAKPVGVWQALARRTRRRAYQRGAPWAARYYPKGAVRGTAA